MSQMYYPLWYRLDAIDGYMIWFSDDIDGVVTQEGGRVPVFRDMSALAGYARANQLQLDDGVPLLHDLDVVVRWLGHPLALDVDCDALLMAWNLFSDLSASVGGDFAEKHQLARRSYNKLFWGNNLPSVTPIGEHYAPDWTDDELLVMRETLASGLYLFRTSVTLI